MYHVSLNKQNFFWKVFANSFRLSARLHHSSAWQVQLKIRFAAQLSRTFSLKQLRKPTVQYSTTRSVLVLTSISPKIEATTRSYSGTFIVLSSDQLCPHFYHPFLSLLLSPTFNMRRNSLTRSSLPPTAINYCHYSRKVQTLWICSATLSCDCTYNAPKSSQNVAHLSCSPSGHSQKSSLQIKRWRFHQRSLRLRLRNWLVQKKSRKNPKTVAWSRQSTRKLSRWAVLLISSMPFSFHSAVFQYCGLHTEPYSYRMVFLFLFLVVLPFLTI